MAYCTEALAYFARMDVQPSTALKNLINNTITGMTSAGIWAELDAFWFMNLHTAQASKLNIKGSGNTQTWYTDTQPVSFSAYTATEITGNNNGVNYSHIDTGFNPSLATKFTQNNAGIYFNINKNGDTTGGADGAYDTNNWNAVLVGYNAYSSNYINQGNNITPDPIWITGSSMFVRTTSNDLITRINGVETGYTYTSGTPPNQTYTLGVMNYGGSLVWGHHTRYKYYGFGSAMDSTKRAAFETILNYFVNNIKNTTGATASYIIGTSPLTFGSSTVIKGKGIVTGTSQITFASNVAIKGKGLIKGISPLTFASNAFFKVKGLVIGTSPLTFGSNVVIKGKGLIKGTSPIAFNSSTVIKGKGLIGANTTLTFGSSTAIKGKGLLSGTSPLTFNIIGNIYNNNSVVISQAIIGTITVDSITGNILAVNLLGNIVSDNITGSETPVNIIGKIISENLTGSSN
jgi:hypothetical protein